MATTKKKTTALHIVQVRLHASSLRAWIHCILFQQELELHTEGAPQQLPIDQVQLPRGDHEMKSFNLRCWALRAVPPKGTHSMLDVGKVPLSLFVSPRTNSR